MSSWGPKSSSLWLSRPLGYWEAQLIQDMPPDTPGPRRCTINNVTHLETEQEVDVALWGEAVRLMVHREPNFRADVDLTAVPPVWIPATDFSKVFSVRDLRDSDCGRTGLKGVWPLVQEEAELPWAYGSGRPLYRHILLRIQGGYVVMQVYHHAAGDGTSGQLAMGCILHSYQALVKGLEVEETSLKPQESVEAFTAGVEVAQREEKIAEMVADKVERAKYYKLVDVPFSREEMEEGRKAAVPGNMTLWREGKEQAYTAVRQRCREKDVTVGSLALAASYMAQAAVVSLVKGEVATLHNVLTDYPVNTRHHVAPLLGDSYCGLYVSEVTIRADIGPGTSLWGLAREIGEQVKSRMAALEHIVFSDAKEQFEMGASTAGLAGSVPPEAVCDLFVSNMKALPFPLHTEWGAKVRSMHTAGSYWAPGFANYLFMLQATDLFCYNMICCTGDRNIATAGELLDIIVRLMEETSVGQEDISLAQLVDSLA